jgi:hypothetical protein
MVFQLVLSGSSRCSAHRCACQIPVAIFAPESSRVTGEMSAVQCSAVQAMQDCRAADARLAPMDVWKALNGVFDLRHVWQHMQCTFLPSSSLQQSPPIWRSLDAYDTPRSFDTFETLFQIETAEVAQAMAIMNASSWSMQPEKLRAYAQKFARGEMQECEPTCALRRLGVRPLQYHGHRADVVVPVDPLAPDVSAVDFFG